MSDKPQIQLCSQLNPEFESQPIPIVFGSTITSKQTEQLEDGEIDEKSFKHLSDAAASAKNFEEYKFWSNLNKQLSLETKILHNTAPPREEKWVKYSSLKFKSSEANTLLLQIECTPQLFIIHKSSKAPRYLAALKIAEMFKKAKLPLPFPVDWVDIYHIGDMRMGKSHCKSLTYIIDNDWVLEKGDWLDYQDKRGFWVDTLVFPRMKSKHAKALFDSINKKF